MIQIMASPTDDSRGAHYDGYMFIVKVSVLNFKIALKCLKMKNIAWYKNWS